VTDLPRTYRGARALAGPLLFLEGTRRARLGEWVRIEVEATPGGPRPGPYRGQVIDAGRELTVVQVFEETVGLAPSQARVTLTGTAAATPVGRELLGRTLSGAGRPLDGLPPPVGEALRPVAGAPLNPLARVSPRDSIETGISAIDGLNTLVRGQKLPVFSGPGLPGLELAARIVRDARIGGETVDTARFAVIFVGMGITHRETRRFLERIEAERVRERTILYLNQTGDPVIERLLAPRVALAEAEFLAFEAGLDVLVVMADVTHYSEALRELAAARDEVPGRRGYPGAMYTDLASLFERAGILRDRPGSLTQIPVVTMPDDDITHPIPDLTGYITEGQIVLDRELHRRGVFPPIDVLPSLSRLMKAGIGAGRTEPWHRAWADQLYAAYGRGRQARTMAAIVGEAGLPEADRRALALAKSFERDLVHQGAERRALGETFRLGWRLLETLPRTDLHRIDDAIWRARPTAGGGGEGER